MFWPKTCRLIYIYIYTHIHIYIYIYILFKNSSNSVLNMIMAFKAETCS